MPAFADQSKTSGPVIVAAVLARDLAAAGRRMRQLCLPPGTAAP